MNNTIETKHLDESKYDIWFARVLMLLLTIFAIFCGCIAVVLYLGGKDNIFAGIASLLMASGFLILSTYLTWHRIQEKKLVLKADILKYYGFAVMDYEIEVTEEDLSDSLEFMDDHEPEHEIDFDMEVAEILEIEQELGESEDETETVSEPEGEKINDVQPS